MTLINSVIFKLLIIRSFEILKEHFTWNTHRQELFEVFEDFLKKINHDPASNIILWVNGSFISNKNTPNDIDVVLFIKTELYQKNYTKYRSLRKQFQPKIDSYFIELFPEKHPLFQHSEMDKLEFFHLFSKDRKKRNKGFIEISYGNS